MASSLFELLVRLALAGSAAIVLVLLLRRPLRRLAGAHAAYQSWMMVPLAMLAAALPALREAPALVLALVPQMATATLVPAAAPAGTAWLEWLLLAWAMGMLAAAALLVRSQRGFVRSLGTLHERDGIHVAANARHGPALLGFWRPRIVVPLDFATRYSAAEQALIITHERLHAERRDPVVNAALALLQCAFWFNPLVHIAASRCRFDQELACDAAVMARNKGQRQAYAEAMLKTQSASAPALATCHWQSSHPLKERIMQLRHTTTSSRRRAGRVIIALLACASVLATVAVRADTAQRNTYMVAFKFTAAGATSAPSVMAAAGEPFAVGSSNHGKAWKGDFLITEGKDGMVWLKSQFTIDGKRGGTHNGGKLRGEVRHVTIVDAEGRDLIAMEATVSRVKKDGSN